MAYDVYGVLDPLGAGLIQVDASTQLRSDVELTDESDGTSDDQSVLGDVDDDTFSYPGLLVGDVEHEYRGAAVDESGNVIGFFASEVGLGGLLGTKFFVPEGTTVPDGLSVTLLGGDTADPSTQWDIAAEAPVCFLEGTHIATPEGERTVESLLVGDTVLTEDGREMTVRWMGYRTCALPFVDARRAIPILIRQGALGGGLPHRDLCVSPTHAIHMDGVLIQAEALLNGDSIRQMPLSRGEPFTYFHIELDEHALVLAEGVASESFADGISTLRFDNWEGRQALRGDQTIPQMDLPRLKAARQLPRALRDRMMLRKTV
ncbi:Hint domain-containing protein [Salipiger marinus]|uniref:Hint domain-containing protein n=1 Tax=Salipiger marinus TaxID=555512 RepID=UPI002C9EC85E|nr:Hint domain-containing protein [Salipiger manganoxidans]MEB3419088.1 Hint domain-containing protein [Salipiger manganoxidans]